MPRPNAWNGDWEARIRERVAAKGQRSVTDYVTATPLATFPELAATLGPDVAVVQLETLLRAEADAQGTVDRFAAASLVRLLIEHLPNGWATADNSEFQAARAYASWISTLGKGLERQAERVWKRLADASAPPPTGWRPSGPEDPLLVRAFEGLTFVLASNGALPEGAC